jgi:hypothetical protein
MMMRMRRRRRRRRETMGREMGRDDVWNRARMRYGDGDTE